MTRKQLCCSHHCNGSEKLILQYLYQGYPLQTHDVHLHLIHFLRGGGSEYRLRIQFERGIKEGTLLHPKVEVPPHLKDLMDVYLCRLVQWASPQMSEIFNFNFIMIILIN